MINGNHFSAKLEKCHNSQNNWWILPNIKLDLYFMIICPCINNPVQYYMYFQKIMVGNHFCWKRALTPKIIGAFYPKSNDLKMAGAWKIMVNGNTLMFFQQFYTVELQWLEHWWLVYHGCFELVLESLGKKSHSCRVRIIWVIFFFYYENGILCVCTMRTHNIPSY